MADLINFTFKGSVIHSKLIGNEPYFLAKDICKLLQHSNTRKAIKDHVFRDDVTKSYTLTNGGNQLALWINESGVYSLILGSKLAKAQEFKLWLTSEVLPSLRNTGHYEIATFNPYSSDIKADIINPEDIKNVLRALLQSYESFKVELQDFKKSLSCLRWLLDEHQKYPDDLEYQVAVLPTLTEKLFNYEDLFNDLPVKFEQEFKVLNELLGNKG